MRKSRTARKDGKFKSGKAYRCPFQVINLTSMDFATLKNLSSGEILKQRQNVLNLEIWLDEPDSLPSFAAKLPNQEGMPEVLLSMVQSNFKNQEVDIINSLLISHQGKKFF